MQTVDSRHKPLSTGLTCSHLEVGVGAAAGRFYPRCEVGTAEDRVHWAAEHGGPAEAGAEVTGTAAARRPARRSGR